MTNLEQLKLNMENQYQLYRQFSRELDNQKDFINGCLTRISVSDDDVEIDKYFKQLIKYAIKDYVEISIKCRSQWVSFQVAFNEYVKVK